MKILCPCGCGKSAKVRSIEFECECNSNMGMHVDLDHPDNGPIEVIINRNAIGPEGPASLDFFALDHERGRIVIKADADLAKELVFVFSTMHEMASRIKTKMYHARAIESACNEADIKRRHDAFTAEGVKVLARYNEKLKENGGDKKAAFKEVKTEFKLKDQETRFVLSEGRRVAREEKKHEVDRDKKHCGDRATG